MNTVKTVMLALCGVMIVAGCKKKDDDNPTPTTPTPPPAPTYPISGTASFSVNNGTNTVVYQDGANGFVNVYSDITNPPTASYSSRFYNDDSETTGASIYLHGNSFSGSMPTDDEFHAFFEPGTRTYASFGPSAQGVSVSYTTGTGIGAGENTSLMVPQPASSTFTITDRELINDGSGVAKVKIRATFNCKLVSTSNGNQSTVSGIFVGTFTKS